MEFKLNVICALIVLLYFPNYLLYSQTETKIKIGYVKSKELRIANELNEIEMLSLICSDKKMHNKRFLIYMDEYRNGVVHNSNILNTNCEDIVRTAIVNGEKLRFVHNICDLTKFQASSNEHEIWFAAKHMQDSLMFHLDYTGSMALSKTLFARIDYKFRVIQEFNNNEDIIIPLGTRIPILAITPPFQIDGGASSYCLLDDEDPGDLYSKYGINHFYIFNLVIE